MRAYNSGMRRVFCCLVLFGISGLSQSVPRDPVTAAAVKTLSSTLLTLKGPRASTSSVSQQLTNDIISSAERDHQPSRTAVVSFANELTGALGGRDLPANALSRLTTSIVEVLQSAGIGTLRFRASVSRAQEALISLGVDASTAQAVASRLMEIGKEVRGPEDIPAKLT